MISKNTSKLKTNLKFKILDNNTFDFNSDVAENMFSNGNRNNILQKKYKTNDFLNYRNDKHLKTNIFKNSNENTDENLRSINNVEEKSFKLDKNATRSLSETNFRSNDDGKISYCEFSKNSDYRQMLNEKLLNEKRKLVLKLEQQNKEIVKEIQKLKLKHLSNKSLEINEQINTYYKVKNEKQPNISENKEMQKKKYKNSLKKNCPNSAICSSSTMIDPALIAELHSLKQRKGQLENRMVMLESSRDELIERITQLDTFIKPSNKSKLKLRHILSINDYICE